MCSVDECSAFKGMSSNEQYLKDLLIYMQNGGKLSDIDSTVKCALCPKRAEMSKQANDN